MEVKSLNRSFWQRLFGIPATKPPADGGCWTYSNGRLLIDLSRVPELSNPGGAIRMEGSNLPDRILVVYGEDEKFRAFRNRCRHMGRRLDPVPGTLNVQCCSISKSTYGYEGNVVYGPAKGPVEVLAVQHTNGKLVIVF
jgi:nitrite reductase/ring-hydroxylating ferredoxin subunit